MYGIRWCMLLLALTTTACRSVPPYLPLGAWSSDRSLTLASYARDPSLASAYRVVRDDSTLFGQNTQVFTSRGTVMWFEGQCGELWHYDYDVLESKPGLLRYRDSDTREERKITWDERLMYRPLAGGRAQEVFRKIPVEQALAEHPCLKAALAGLE